MVRKEWHVLVFLINTKHVSESEESVVGGQEQGDLQSYNDVLLNTAIVIV
jgi:hypothetical protein